MRRRFGWILATFSAAALGLTALPPARAQSGYCLIGCARDRDYILNYRIQERIHDHNADRWHLYIPEQKTAVRQVQILPEEAFNGAFNTGAVEISLRRSGKTIKLEGTTWDGDERSLTIALAEPVPAGEEIEVVLSQVQNPTFEGLFKFNGRVLGTEPNPIFRYVGTWTITFE